MLAYPDARLLTNNAEEGDDLPAIQRVALVVITQIRLAQRCQVAT